MTKPGPKLKINWRLDSEARDSVELVTGRPPAAGVVDICMAPTRQLPAWRLSQLGQVQSSGFSLLGTLARTVAGSIPDYPGRLFEMLSFDGADFFDATAMPILRQVA
jgi:hypothetical protein